MPARGRNRYFACSDVRIMKKILRTVSLFVVSLISLIIISVCLSVIICSYHIKTSEYEIHLDGVRSPARFVVVADIHGKEYGRDNQRLLNKVQDQQPDAIVMLGDIFPSDFEQNDLAYVVQLTDRLQSIAQVYFAMGNHELSYTTQYGEDWISKVEDTGAIVLDESWADVDIAGNTIRLGGTMGHGYYFGRSKEVFEASPEFQVLSAL